LIEHRSVAQAPPEHRYARRCPRDLL